MPRRKKAHLPPLALEKKTIKLIFAVVILSFSFLIVGSLFSQAAVLVSLREGLYRFFGIGIVFLPFFGLLAALILFSIKFRLTKINVIFGALGSLLSALGI